MSEIRIEDDLRETELRLLDVSRRVDICARHKAQLRAELLRRHQELTNARAERPALWLWHHLGGLKRLALVAPPALAAVVAFSVLILGLQVTGHQRTQSAEAQIVSAFARTAPYVDSWTFTITEQKDGKTQVLPYSVHMGKNQILAFYYGRPYLYINHTWYQVTLPASELAGPMTPSNWRIANAVFPTLLKQPGIASIPGTRIRGQDTEAWTYSVAGANGERVVVTAWVQRSRGLVLRIERVVRQGSKVIEHDIVDYQYRMRGA